MPASTTPLEPVYPTASSDSPPPLTPRSPIKKILIALSLPLFFVIVFPLIFVGVLHQPTPQNVSLLIEGPTDLVAPIAAKLDATDTFTVVHTDSPGDAKAAVEERRAAGAVSVVPASSTGDGASASTVTTYVANAGGRALVSVITGVGADIAESLGTTNSVVDVAPLAPADPTGSSLFYLLIYTSLGAYLVIIVLTQVMPRVGLRVRYLAVGITSIAAPLVVFGLSSIFVGDYGASFGTIAALLGVNALYVFTIGAIAILIEQFLGNMATFGVMAFVVLLNFATAGGAAPAGMLPPFWQVIHNTYFGAGAYESFRSIIYFDGNGVGRWLLQLGAWTVGIVLVTVIVHLGKVNARHSRELARLSAQVAVTASTSLSSPQLSPSRSLV